MSMLKLIWDLWYDCRFIVMVLCPSDISIWVNTGHRTTQHLSNFHPSPALLQPGDTVTANLFICHGDCCGHQISAGDCYLGLASVGVQCGARHSCHTSHYTRTWSRWSLPRSHDGCTSLSIVYLCYVVNTRILHCMSQNINCPLHLPEYSVYLHFILSFFCIAIFVGLSN